MVKSARKRNYTLDNEVFSMYRAVIQKGTEVLKEEVVKEWILAEYEKADKPLEDNWRDSSLYKKEQMLMDVWCRQPISVFWDHEPIRWFKKTVTEKELRSLKLITGPSGDGGWKNFSRPDGKAETVARRV